MVIKKLQLLFLAALTAFVIVSCGVNHSVRTAVESPATRTDCRRIPHQMGETEICGKPQRVVALGPDMLELLLALDVQPVGFGDYVRFEGDYDNPTQQIPYLGNRITKAIANVGWSANPSLEALVKVKPDLIISRALSADLYATLSKIAPTLFLKQFDTEANLRAIASSVDTPQAEQVIAQMQQTISEARQEFASTVASHPQVLMLIASGTSEMRLVSSTDNPCSALIQELGFQLVYPPNFDSAQQKALPLSVEELPNLNQADSMIILGFDFALNDQSPTADEFATYQVEQAKQRWQNNAVAQSLQASQAGRTYFIPAYTCLGLPGPIGTQLYLNELQQMRKG
ncbi:iron-siderophore ABC transporter substrate-binding protein [Chroogloeocystis siderophila]|uniref:ABC transporter substrate-binding protein n=1 Tax=Chroogloeocystis siderophila TaxID=329163 RepID=UPI000A049CF1|nr:iron-siderophore ABC transporter substrate-binding protein [Chroogloeocystis siderophila]